jgi:hypothetical protein
MKMNLSPPRYASTREPTAWNCECRAMTDLAKTTVDREATAERTCPVHRGPGGGMHEQTGRVKWGTTRRRSGPRTKKISRGLATSGSDEAIVSDDLTGQHNRSGSQGPLDESVWEGEAVTPQGACPQGPQACQEHTGAAYKSGYPPGEGRGGLLV